MGRHPQQGGQVWEDQPEVTDRRRRNDIKAMRVGGDRSKEAEAIAVSEGKENSGIKQG